MGSMVVVAAAVLVLCGAGCKEDEHFPPGEGGGPGGGGAGDRDAGDVDAGDAGDAGDQLRGQLCDVTDVREPDVDENDCEGSSGIDVDAPGSEEPALTDADGDFTLDVEFQSSLVLAVGRDDDETRDAIARVDMWGGEDPRVPRVAQDAWDDLLSSLSIQDTDGTAAVLLYVEDSEGQPLAGAVVGAIGSALIFHDDDGNKDGWSPGGTTGPLGATLMVQVPAEEDDVAVTVDGGNFTIPVRPDHLTWARVP